MTEPPPTVIGRYAIFGRIAAGGMASVHIGRLLGEAGFARTVAIKRLHPQFALDPDFRAMFTDEARICSRIRHPNVVPTLDVFDRDGELFLVMEYVEGESLAQLLRASRAAAQVPSPSVVASVISGMLHGLHAAHDAKSDVGEPLGIVHRDVSPQNVLVGSDGTPRVLDFGVAKALGRLHTTREGAIKGKLAYMAPEQIQGGEVSRRTDIFAAAAVLWESLTTERLFQAENEARRMHMILHEPIRPPSAIVAGISPELDAVVMRGLERNSADRFASALEMAEALERAVTLATPRVVGVWVSSLSADELTLRAERVAEVESYSSGPGAPVKTTVAGANAMADATIVDAASQTQASSISVSRSNLPEERNRRRIVGGLIAAAVVAASGAWIARTSWPGPVASPVLAASSNAAPPAGEPPAGPAIAEATPPPSASVTADASASVEPTRRPPPPPKRQLPTRPKKAIYTRE